MQDDILNRRSLFATVGAVGLGAILSGEVSAQEPTAKPAANTPKESPFELLVELVRLNARYAESFQAFFQALRETRAHLTTLDRQFKEVAKLYKYKNTTAFYDLDTAAYDLGHFVSITDLEEQLVELTEKFAKRIKHVSDACKSKQ